MHPDKGYGLEYSKFIKYGFSWLVINMNYSLLWCYVDLQKRCACLSVEA